MEHLYLPQGASPDLVRYRGSSNYLGMSFEEYAERFGHGYFLQPVPQITWTTFRELHHIEKDNILHFLETWLFCSLIQEMFGVVSELVSGVNLYSHENFVREWVMPSPIARDAIQTSSQVVDVSDLSPDSSIRSLNLNTNEVNSSTKYFFCTSKLPEFLESWASQLKGRTGHFQVEHRRLVQCFWTVHNVLTWVGSEFDTASRSVICVTAEFLGTAIDRVFKEEEFFNESVKCPMAWGILGWRQPDVDEMILHGWCPSEVAALGNRGLPLQVLRFLANIKRHYPLNRHASCDETICMGHQTLQNPCHRKNCHSCKVIRIVDDLMTQMMEIINHHHIPLIELDIDTSTSKLDLRIVPYTPDSEYVAISHVWSHGLGNPTANELPQCQILHLHEVVRRVLQSNKSPEDQKALFWIDTLCCPATDESGKVKVFSQMRKIYGAACCELILDSELQHTSFDQAPRLEIALRLLHSDWMKRLWTLQEAYLAKQLCVELGDRICYVDSLQNLKYEAEPVNRMWIAMHVRELYFSIRKRSSTNPQFSLHEFDFLLTASRGRHVTKDSDEPICLATLLGLETEAVAETPEFQRMQKLWELMPQTGCGVPSSIIFRRGPKLEVPGYCWAPSTLLVKSFNDLMDPLYLPSDASHRGTLHPRGLLVQFRGLMLSKVGPIRTILQQSWGFNSPGWLTYNGNSCVARDQNGRWYNIIFLPTEFQTSCKRLRKAVSEPHEKIADETCTQFTELINSSEGFQYAVILRGSPSNIGLFVKIQEVDTQMVCVKALHHVGCHEDTSVNCKMYEVAFQKALSLERYFSIRDFSILDSLTPRTSVLQIWTAIQAAATNAFLENPDLESLMQKFKNLSKDYMNLLISQFLANCFHFAAQALPDSQVWCVD